MSISRFGMLLPLLLCSVIAPAQQAPATQSPAASVNPHPIYLDVVVSPKDGAPVAGFTQKDFTVLDNKASQPITLFHALGGSESPVAVIVLIDAVNMTAPSVAYASQEIERFLRANNGQLAYPTQLAIFTDTGTKIQNGFTRDGNALSAALAHSAVGEREIRTSAGFYGASERLQLSIKALRQLAAAESASAERKIVLWVSPGWPILSNPGVQIGPKQQQSIYTAIVNLSTELRRAHITLYSIDPQGTADFGLRTSYYQNFLKGVRKPGDAEYANLALQVLAVQSGGQALNTSQRCSCPAAKSHERYQRLLSAGFHPGAG
jgi:VWFA-related protein